MTEADYKQMFSLEGKTAIVTGGAGILGTRFCKGLAEFGANVAVVDMRADAATALAGSLRETYGVPALGFGCDISDPEEVAAVVGKVVEKFGCINILHNNAASKSEDLEAFFAPFEDYALSEWRKIMAVNIDGMFLMAQAVGKQMRKQRIGGSIVQTSSIYGIVAPDQRIYEGSEYNGRPINTPAVYSASKAAVIGLTQYLATYWAPFGIRVNTLTPGGNESGQNSTFVSNYSYKVPMGRMGKPSEMVGALIYLASEASTYVTGQNLVVDGGFSVW